MNLDARSAETLDDLGARLEEIERLPIARQDLLAVAASQARGLRRRFEEGARAPLRLALFGPTGGGKSKLFNTLIGGEVSAAGFRRPYTMQPVTYVHEHWASRLRDLPGEPRPHRDEACRGLVLTDTPDFDSVERRNLEEAERIYASADAYLFVTDTQKYGDESTWEYLGRILASERPVIVVLNKVASAGAASDFFRLVDERSGASTRIIARVEIEDYPIDDRTPIPVEDAGVRAIREAIQRLSASLDERASLRVASFHEAINGFLALAAGIASEVSSYETGLEALERRLTERFEEGARTLQREFEADVDPASKKEFYSRVLERIERIDPFRYPRKLLALPLEGVRAIYRKWRPGSDAAGTTEPGDAPPDRAESFRALEGLLLRLAEETRRDFTHEDLCPGLLASEDFFRVALSHDELRALYVEKMERYKSWLREEAFAAADNVTGEHKAKFLVAQLIYNSLVVGAQVHTAGAFTLTELLADSVLSPIVAKGIGMALSSERVAAFEKQAQEEYQRLLRELIDTGNERFARVLTEAGEWRPAWRRALAVIEKLRGSRQQVEEAFATRGLGVVEECHGDG